ncbi:ABC transporter substrate-binding protein [Phytoactinopolyspora alkaliphila]|uniref:ABC transporter substrate-binding protein n=1 Tax=Phytoactinopolyspora alkaliphila TaxID=1783498 RepID=A0A6N9YII4_9ACTN|nr:ABC transporter substrate-binding protein [Phytoactinopolyspora alkaliphila]NED94767.1 ABC transporter substrate-binding protein [Phytoactinopolyspora alkaliphila]
MNRRNMVIRTAGLLGASIILTACGSDGGGMAGSGSGDEPSGEQSTALRVAFPQEPPDWDFTRNGATAIKALVVHNVVEPLLEKTEDGSFEPLLAESYEVSDDGLEYTFTIRAATFHDDSELTSADVVYSLETSRTSSRPEISGPLAAVESIEAIDDTTVSVTLERPSQSFLDSLSGVPGLVIPEDSVETLAQQPVGTGPFVFGEWRNGVSVSLNRFEDYWADLPYFEDITWQFFADETASLNALLSGDVDIVSNLIGEGLERFHSIDETDGFQGVSTAGSEFIYLVLSAEAPAFDDERVRQAIAHAIDRQPIIDGASGGLGQPSCVFVNPPNVEWNSDYCPYPYDPDAARALLAEAGAEDLSIDFTHITSGFFPPTMEVVRSQLTDVGINVEPVGLELTTYLDEILGDDPTFEMTVLSGPQQADSWQCPGWFSDDCVEEFDQLLTDADQALDREDWADLRRQAVELLADRAYVIPVANQDEVSATRDDLVGVKPYRSASELDLRPLRWAE